MTGAGFPYLIRARPRSLARGDESGCFPVGLLTYELSTYFSVEETNSLPGFSPVAYLFDSARLQRRVRGGFSPHFPILLVKHRKTIQL